MAIKIKDNSLICNNKKIMKLYRLEFRPFIFAGPRLGYLSAVRFIGWRDLIISLFSMFTIVFWAGWQLYIYRVAVLESDHKEFFSGFFVK